MLNKRLCALIGGLATAGLGYAGAAQADSVADFYSGKRIQLVVGFGAGGGYALYAQLLSEYWPKYIPGHPEVLSQYMAGAGSLKAANYVYNAAPKDGTNPDISEPTLAGHQSRKPQDRKTAV